MATATVERKKKTRIAKSQMEVANACDVSVPTVRDWLRKGCPGKQGKYDLDKIDAWCEQNGLGSYGVGHGKPSPEPTESEAELRRQKLAEEVEWKRLQNAKKKGELVERASVLPAVSQMCANIRSRLEALPEEAASGFPPDQKMDVILQWRHLIELTLKELEGMADDHN